tara:strand:+ start:346 stop:1269 length:924 start_codon:yes stop_codon:yes gene_type:complete
MKSFKLSNGYELPIVDGFREQIKSNWRNAYKNFEYDPIPIEKTNKLKYDIKTATHILSKYGITLDNKKIMDVGCYLGIQCFGAIELGAKEAVGIDIPEYYVNQSIENVDASKILEQRRNDVRKQHPNLDQSKISFHDVSVFEMDFDNEFDIIFSWETFEHIIDPKEALKRIYKALKPGGLSFHNYNPFFCSSGGHSMCTLDYPFAHILLTNEDFKKYTTEIIPKNPPKKYSELSYNFFTKNLNRMTQQDLKNYIKEAGFKTLDFITMPDFNVLNYLDDSVLTAAQSLYPTLTLKDLLCSNVYFLIQK